MKKILIEKIKKIKVLTMDVDGVLTSGKINLNEQGKEVKNFDVYDGFGLFLWRNAGLKTAIISARFSFAVSARAKDLKIDHVYQDAYPKMNTYKKMLKIFGVKDENVCFMGDDLPDICILKRVGFSVAVANAATEVKENADYVTKKTGGNGAVREVIELILKTQGQWKGLIQPLC
ncbi:MAG TPA: HAD-IIIA family hydrolase [Candidatus Omnitrophota bacterium]|nr:HAD-IIIA family hydrolase [Candidatus Omnitrophota bacterium]HPN87877.1 HAD-IIIA family hydrolase [Candidatus Omnitrophota bacterium]